MTSLERVRFLSVALLSLSPFAVVGWDDRSVTPLLQKVQNQIQAIVSKEYPEGKVVIEERETVVCKCRTRHFMIHGVDRQGRVSVEARDAIGPDFDGCIVRSRKGVRNRFSSEMPAFVLNTFS